MKKHQSRSLQVWVCVVGLLAIAEMASAAGDPASESNGTGKASLLDKLPDLSPRSDYRGASWHEGSCALCFGRIGDVRQDLYEHGFALDVGVTQVPQGVVSGGLDEKWEYGGSADYYLYLDSGRLGLWPGGMIGIHAESGFGQNVNAAAGTVSPVRPGVRGAASMPGEIVSRIGARWATASSSPPTMRQ